MNNLGVHHLKTPNLQPDTELSGDDQGEGKKNKKSANDLQVIKSIKQLETTELDLYSPRFQKACVSLGIPLRDCVKKRKENFADKGLADDIVELRFKHFQNRQIDLLNRILDERKKIKNREIVHEKLMNQSQPPAFQLNKTSGQQFFSPQNDKSMNLQSRTMGGGNIQNSSGFKTAMNKMCNQSQYDNQKRFASTSKMFMSPQNMRSSFEDHWSFEQDKMQKYKQKKVFRAQMLIDQEQTKLQRDKQYQAKLDEIEKKFKEDSLVRKELKTKHNMKLEQAKLKNDQIQKDQQYQQIKMQEKAEKDMQSKSMKHDMIERLRMEELRKREEEFEKKRKKIDQMKRERDQEELQLVAVNMKQFEYKIKESNDKHAYQIQRVISEARLRNSIQQEKVNKWKEDKQRQEMEEMQQMFKSEEKYLKKMQNIAKSTQDLHKKIKEKKLSKLEKQNQNKQAEDGHVEQKLKQIMEKFRQAESNVELIRKEKEHEIQLKHELRRLKEEDRKKERERQERLDKLKKRRILKRTKETQSQIEFFKLSEQEIQRKRMQESIRSMIEYKNMFQTVQTVIQAKNLPIKEKSKILRDHSLEIKPQFIEKKK
eukprot:403356677